MNIAIIPARGGSKRIKNKNSKIFFGKPIISYAIQLALKSKIFEEVIVSSNDKKIIKMSKKYGAKILFKRPKYLSKITLYKEKEVVDRNIEEKEAVQALIDLIKKHGDWVEPVA